MIAWFPHAYVSAFVMYACLFATLDEIWDEMSWEEYDRVCDMMICMIDVC